MADNRRSSRQTLDNQSNIISRCGSISGDAFVSLRSRRSCNRSSRQAERPVDLFAKNLKEFHANRKRIQGDDVSCCASDLDVFAANSADTRQRLNGCFHSYRFVIAVLAGMSVGIMLFLRYGMTIAILRMVNQTHIYLEENPNRTMQDFLDEGYVPGGEFIWNNEMVAIILGWYMFAYTLPQTMAAKVNLVLGCRFSIPIALSLCSISNLLTPTAAYLGWQWVVVCRLLNGLGAAGVLPGMLNLLEDWMRYDELSSGLSTSSFVVACMAATCPLISGYLTAIHWSMSFYVPSCVTLVFCAIWILLVTNKPRANWLVSERELEHLCDCNMTEPISEGPIAMAEDKTSEKPANEDGSHAKPVANDELDQSAYEPSSWLQILKLRSFYAYLFIWSINCSSYSCFTFILPAYMRQFLKIHISENGFYCFIIQSGGLLAVSWPHQLLRLLLNRRLSMTRARHLAQSLSSIMMAVTFIYVGTFHQFQLPLLFLNRCFVATDVIVTGSIMSNFAKAGLSSMAFAMINTIGNLSITGTSTLFGWLLDYTGSSALGWQIIFCGLGLAQLVMLATFWLFVDSEPIRFRSGQQKAMSSTGAEGTFSSSIQAIEEQRPRGGMAQQRQQNDGAFKGSSRDEK